MNANFNKIKYRKIFELNEEKSAYACVREIVHKFINFWKAIYQRRIFVTVDRLMMHLTFYYYWPYHDCYISFHWLWQYISHISTFYMKKNAEMMWSGVKAVWNGICKFTIFHAESGITYGIPIVIKLTWLLRDATKWPKFPHKSQHQQQHESKTKSNKTIATCTAYTHAHIREKKTMCGHTEHRRW